jgi:prophage antirepressor-like protein
METMIERFGESKIHIIDADGEKWINAADCAKALDYKNYREAVSQFILSNQSLLDTCVRKMRTQVSGQGRESWHFNERGLIAFLVKTNQPKAIPFQKWAIDVLAKEIKKKVEGYTELRAKSKKIRVEFTDTLKAHGYQLPKEYIQTTYFMKTRLGIDKHRPKNDLSVWELCKVSMAETLSMANLALTEADGYHECKPVIEKSSDVVASIEPLRSISKE